jgi:vancomycin permeability regulator SanA
MSGDHGQVEYDEVSAMRDYVLDNGIPAENVFLDHAGFSTYDSIYRARDVFGAKKIIIVSQRYHLYRALYLAQSLGLEAVGVDAELRTYVGQAWRDTREVIARVKDFAYGVFKPKPTYLGEQIDLSGDGRITWDN